MAGKSADEETTLALLLDLPPSIIAGIEKNGEGIGTRLRCRIVGLSNWQQAIERDTKFIATTLNKLEIADSSQLDHLKEQGAAFLLVMYRSEDVEAIIERGSQILEGARINYAMIREEDVFSVSMLLAPYQGGSLTAREVEVLQLVAEGKSNKEIGTELYLSPGTAKSHLEHIFRKLGVKGDRALAVAIGFQRGYLA